MTDNITVEDDVVNLTPTEGLIIEVLTARYRMGENSWTFSSKNNKALGSLEDKGLVNWKSSSIEGYSLVWLTDAAKVELFAKKYKPYDGWVSLKKRSKELRKEAKRLRKRNKSD